MPIITRLAAAVVVLIVLAPGAFAMDNQTKCLADIVYTEARSEPLKGQMYVASVVLNRVAKHSGVLTICQITAQPHQFAGFRFRNRILEPALYTEAVRVAEHIQRVGPVTRATFFFDPSRGTPVWAKGATSEKVGSHVFVTK